MKIMVFCSKGVKKNSGSYFYIIIISLSIASIILFYIKAYISFKKNIVLKINAKFTNDEEEQQNEHFPNVFIIKLNKAYDCLYFFVKDDYNLFVVKIYLILFWFSIDNTMKGMFFKDKTMYEIYEYNGEYRFRYQIPLIIYPIIISSLITRLLEYFVIFEDKITKIIKENIEEHKSEITKKINKYIDSIN